MKKSVKIICIVLPVFVVLLFIGLFTGYLLIETEDYIKTEKSGNELIVRYNGNVYHLYCDDGRIFFPENNQTIFRLSSEIKGERIGYTHGGNFIKYDAMMLNGTGDNVIVTVQGMGNKYIWVKERYLLADIFDAEYDRIEYADAITEEKICLFDKRETLHAMSNIADSQNYFQSDEKISPCGTVTMRLDMANSLQVTMCVCAVDSQYYLRYVDAHWNHCYYFVNEELQELLSRHLPMFD